MGKKSVCLKVRRCQISKKQYPLIKEKEDLTKEKRKEGLLFSLDSIKKVEGNLGSKKSFPVFLILYPSIFSQVYCSPNNKAKDPFDKTCNIGKIR